MCVCCVVRDRQKNFPGTIVRYASEVQQRDTVDTVTLLCAVYTLLWLRTSRTARSTQGNYFWSRNNYNPINNLTNMS